MVLHPQGRPLRDRDNAKGAFRDNTLAWLDRDLAPPKGKDGITTLIVAMHVPAAHRRDLPHGTGTTTRRGARKLLAILKRTVLRASERSMRNAIRGDGKGPSADLRRAGARRTVPRYGVLPDSTSADGKVRESFRRVLCQKIR